MTRAFMITSIVGLVTAYPAAAQSDTQQILQLLQKMDQRFQTIENRLDQLESSPTPSPTTAPSQSTPSHTYVPGWRLSIAPLTETGQPAETPIARAHVPIGPVKFDQHFKQGPVTNFVNYRGSALFRAKTAGRYSFSIAVEPVPGSRNLCWTRLSVDDAELIQPERFPDEGIVTRSGGIELQEGEFQLTYDIGCRNALSSPLGNIHSGGVEQYKKTRYNVTVLGPEDDVLRDFAADELFVLKK